MAACAGAVMDRVAVAVPPADNATLPGLIDMPGPCGNVVSEKLTVPAKPLRLVTVIVAVLVVLTWIEMDDRLEAMLKSAPTLT